MQLCAGVSLLAVTQDAESLAVACCRVDANVSKATLLIVAQSALEVDAGWRIVR